MTDLHIPASPVSPAPQARGGDSSLTLDDSVFNRLLKERIVFLGSEVNDQVANRICAQMLLLAAEDDQRDIWLYINSTTTSPRSRWAWPRRWASCCCAPAPAASGWHYRTRGS